VTQKCAVQKASVDVNISYYYLKKKTIHGQRGPGFFFIIKLILDYYFCLMSGPVFLFQIFIIASSQAYIFKMRTSLQPYRVGKMCVAAMSLCMIALIVSRKKGDGRYYFAL
jgi:hypothetical protein